ncbi:MAG: hypothetical protein AB8B74_04065 [Crocinitomicaceae bacterium]
MKRIQLFEFEDFNWFPDVFRRNMTKLIVVFNKLLKLDEVVAESLKPILEKQNANLIVDLGSGAGGIMPHVHSELVKEKNNLQLTLSDLHPNREQIEAFASSPNVNYFSESLNATSLATSPAGVKTMVNCFHHMPLPVAKSILKSAQESKQTLCIYELTNKPLPLIVWWLFLPIGLTIVFLSTLILTPFTKPITWQQLVFTYIIPIIPLAYAWDGQASMPRTYTKTDLETLVSELPNDPNYSWKYEVGKTKGGKSTGYCFVGQPK